MWLTCQVCGGSFEGRSDARYCGGECRSKAHRARHLDDPREYASERARKIAETLRARAEVERRLAGK